MKPLQAPQLPQASGAVPVGGGRPRSAIAGPRELSAAEGLGPGGAPSEPSTQRRHGTWRRTHPANPTLGGIGRGQPRPMAERGTRSPHPANPRSGTRQPPLQACPISDGDGFYVSWGRGSAASAPQKGAALGSVCAQSALLLRPYSPRPRSCQGALLPRPRSPQAAPPRPGLLPAALLRPRSPAAALLRPLSASAPGRRGTGGRRRAEVRSAGGAGGRRVPRSADPGPGRRSALRLTEAGPGFRLRRSSESGARVRSAPRGPVLRAVAVRV